MQKVWERIFSIASTITPFLLGAAAAAVASGQVGVPGSQDQSQVFLSSWTTPFALTIGALALALCAVLAALNLIVGAQNSHDAELVEVFRRRALIAGAFTLVLDAVAFTLSPFEAPVLWNGMLAHALPLVLMTGLIGLSAAASLFLRRYRLARMLGMIGTCFIFGSWGVSQLPYLLPVTVTFTTAASPPSTLLALLIGTSVGMVLLLPSLWLLFHVFNSRRPVLLTEEASNRTPIHHERGEG
jgi:cytochrome d ubiquinol oxidase subunit II